MVGGTTNHKYAGFYNPSTNSYCDLPQMVPNRVRHAVTGLTACGDAVDPSDPVYYKTSCSRFNVSSGQWFQSHLYTTARVGSVAWQTSDGIYLIGGNNNNAKTSSSLLLPDGTESPNPGFTLAATSYFSCAVEDVKQKSIIIIGGYDAQDQTQLKTVYRYDTTGVQDRLPDLNNNRSSGCGGYYNDRGYLVLLVFGGGVAKTEMLVYGQDDAWTELGDRADVKSKYPFAVTIDNDIFMQGNNV